MKNKIYLLIFLIWILSAGITLSQNISDEKNPEKLPAPKFKYYNDFPGSQKINLFEIEKKREILSQGVISPDFTKMAYSEVYFYPQNSQTLSRVFYVPLTQQNSYNSPENAFSQEEIEKIKKIKSKDIHPELIVSSGLDSFDNHIFRSLTIVDWSQDSKKILIKETIGENQGGIWATNLWVYNFAAKKAVQLDNIRKAVIYYWRYKQQFYLNDYRWDIVPLGWDINNPDQIIVNVYGYSNKAKHFLGCWKVDSEGRRSQLISLDNESYPVAKHGLMLTE